MRIRFLFSVLFASGLGCGGASGAKPGATMATLEDAPISGVQTATDDGTTPSGDATKTYPIHLHRSEHVGDRDRVVLDLVEDDVISIHLPSRTKELAHKHLIKHLHLDGVWTTTALDSHQEEIRATFEVTTLTDDDAVLLKNKRIDVTKGVTNADAILIVDGKPLSAKIRKTLLDLCTFRIDAANSADALLGSAQPQSVGSHWPINGDRAKEDLMADNGAASTSVSGEATLMGVEHVANVDVLRIKLDLQLDGVVYPLHHPGATCEPTQGKTVETILFPLDENRSLLESHSSFVMTARIHVPGPHGRSVVGDIDSATQRDAYVTPL